MTRAEKSVFDSLKTEEDKKRFQLSFWKIRDPKPETPQNEFQIEFYNRRQYARSRLGGPHTDRGRIYILLGEPLEKKNFSGSPGVIDCELWIYRGEKRPGLPPFMYLLFFKRRNIGAYELFHPGVHTALDIITPVHTSSLRTKELAYDFIRMDYPELASATLSVMPGEGDIYFPASAQSSNYVFTQIYTLPEKEFEKTYLKSFMSIEGEVDVTYSFNEIDGKGNISISENRGIKFLNFSIMPDVIHTLSKGEDSHTANLNINIRVEDRKGKTIYQKERNFDLKLDDFKRKDIEDRKAVFEDFAPIIDGKFNIKITFTNRSIDEFFIFTESVEIGDKTIPVIVGFKVEEMDSADFMPFSTGTHRVMADPRFIFNKDESLEGIVMSEEKPEILLINIDNENDFIEIENIVKRENFFVFELPLQDIKADNYNLSVEVEKRKIYRKIISVLPFRVEKPLIILQAEPSSSESNYIFLMAQEYLNKGDLGAALGYFNRLPDDLWNSKTLPVIARAYYLKKDYEKVVELLEREVVEKNYSTILLLANSSLELKRLRKAAEYFEMLRAYGDTVKINEALGAVYYSLGEREKAKIYWDRAKNLKKKSQKK